MRKGRVIAAVVVACLAVAAGAVFLVRASAADYEAAARLERDGDAQAAYAKYAALGDYADARERAAALVEADPALPYRSAAKGDIVEFGTWEQDSDASNGAEPVKWVVLDKVGGRLLLLSESCLVARPYNPAAFGAVTWEECELRAWLNGEFADAAFSAAEAAIICEARNVNEDRIGSADEDAEMLEVIMDSESGADELGRGGADTDDRVFLLSETDTLIYLHDEMSQTVVGKAQLVDAARGGQVRVDEEGYAGWWLRSPGVYSFTAQFVDESGAPYTAGAYVELDYGVRPAVWIDVSDGRGASEAPAASESAGESGAMRR